MINFEKAFDSTPSEPKKDPEEQSAEDVSSRRNFIINSGKALSGVALAAVAPSVFGKEIIAFSPETTALNGDMGIRIGRKENIDQKENQIKQVRNFLDELKKLGEPYIGRMDGIRRQILADQVEMRFNVFVARLKLDIPYGQNLPSSDVYPADRYQALDVIQTIVNEAGSEVQIEPEVLEANPALKHLFKNILVILQHRRRQESVQPKDI